MLYYAELAADFTVIQQHTLSGAGLEVADPAWRQLSNPIDWNTRPNTSSVLKWQTADTAPSWIDPRTLDEAKVQAWTRIKAARDAAEVADFTCNGNVYQADRERINGAVTMAVLAQLQSQPYSIVWTLSNNTTITLDGPGMMAVGAALGQRTKDVFNTGVSLRAQKDAATTNAAADAVVWPA